MSALFELVVNQQWQGYIIAHILSIEDGDAADQLFYQSQYHSGMTAVMFACRRSAPLGLVQMMITNAKLDSRKRCLLAITSGTGHTALHYAACHHSNLAVVELLIREYPLALSATTNIGGTPRQLATVYNRSAAFTSLLADATNALAARDYAALAASVHSDERTINLAILGPRFAVRASLLLCLKHVHPDVPVTPTEPLDLRLAHARLCKDVWSVILEFV